MSFKDEIRSTLPTEPTDTECIQVEANKIKAAIRDKARLWHSPTPFTVTLYMTTWLMNDLTSDFLEKKTESVEERGFLGIKKSSSHMVCSLSPKAYLWQEQLSNILSCDGIRVGEWKLGYADYDYIGYCDDEHFEIKCQIDASHPYKLTEGNCKGLSLGLEIEYIDSK